VDDYFHPLFYFMYMKIWTVFLYTSVFVKDENFGLMWSV